MRTQLVRIGNSRGVRIPKPLLEQAGLTDAVELVVEEGRIVISRIAASREGWAEAAAEMAARGEDQMIAPPAATAFDREEWEW